MIWDIFSPQKSWNSCFGNSNQFCWIFHGALECSSCLGTAYRNSLQKVCPFASRQNAFHVCALLLMFNYSEAFSWNGLGSWTVVRRKKIAGFSHRSCEKKIYFLKNTYFSMRCCRSQNGTDLAKWGHKKQDVRNQIQNTGCHNNSFIFLFKIRKAKNSIKYQMFTF